MKVQTPLNCYVTHIEVIKMDPYHQKMPFWGQFTVENNVHEFFGGDNNGGYSWNGVFIVFRLLDTQPDGWSETL